MAEPIFPKSEFDDDFVYNDPGATAYHQLNRARELKSLRQRAKLLGFELVNQSTGEVLLHPVS